MIYAKEGTTVPVQIGDALTETPTGQTVYVVRLDDMFHVWVTPDKDPTPDSPTFLRPISLLGLVEVP